VKRILPAAIALSLLSGAAAMAQPGNPYRGDQTDDRGNRDRNDQDHNNDRNRNDEHRNDQGGNRDRRDDPSTRYSNERWSRGDRLPNQYRQNQYVESNWRQHGLRQPPRGYHWVRNDGNDYFLVAIATGLIAEAAYGSDRDQLWRQRYTNTYNYSDDSYYRDCRSSPDPAGVIAGALIGGLLGNAVSHSNGGATVAGVIIGGATGAALTRNLNCEDRSYAYKTYYDGFNSGRPNSSFQWRNPSNGHYGNFRVLNYANDRDGFRCANYNQEIFVNGRPQTTTGRACQQPDGNWAIIS